MKTTTCTLAGGKRNRGYWLGLAALVLIGFASCEKNSDNDGTTDEQYEKIQPKGPKPEWGPTITPQMQTVIETLDSISPTPLQTLTPQFSSDRMLKDYFEKIYG